MNEFTFLELLMMEPKTNQVKKCECHLSHRSSSYCSQADDKYEEEFALNQTLLSQGWNKCYYFAIPVFILHKLYIAKFAHLPTIRILMLEYIWSPHECFALVYIYSEWLMSAWSVCWETPEWAGEPPLTPSYPQYSSARVTTVESPFRVSRLDLSDNYTWRWWSNLF